jgi:hypothetical protein
MKCRYVGGKYMHFKTANSYPDHPFSAELGNMKINTQILGVLARGADLNLGSGTNPLREGIESP